MKKQTPDVENSDRGRRIRIVSALVLTFAVLAAYSNSFSTPFFFDDNDVIKSNPSIRSLATALAPPPADGMTVSGRPLVNLSLAVNYAAGGFAVTGYHVVNLALHLATALVLFGFIRRALSGGVKSRWNDRDATLVAFSIALVWALHPLQTESVTYISQRAESLVSMFYLLTLYCFVRGAETVGSVSSVGAPSLDGLGTLSLSNGLVGARAGGASAAPTSNPAPSALRRSPSVFWLLASVLCCFSGMATKEVMVSAPIAVLAYDAIFSGEGAWAALRRRAGYYIGLFLSWILLGVLVAQSAGRGGTAGVNAGISVWNYLLTQCKAVVLYIRLAIWPHPLVFDYGVGYVRSPSEIILPALILAVLIGVTVYAMIRRPRIGFIAAIFFAILAPSSSFVPVATQTIAEHRVYLALAALVSLVVLALWRCAGRWTVAICIAWAVLLGALTFTRNFTYASELALWSDSAKKNPGNSRAHSNLGKAYLVLGREADAVTELETALRIGPPTAEAHFNRGLIAERHGEIELAGSHYDKAAIINPRYAEAHNNLGLMLDASGRREEAIREVSEAVRLNPDLPEAQVNLGNLLARSGRVAEAMPHFVRGIELTPKDPVTHVNYATALFESGQLDESLKHLIIARDLDPNNPNIRLSLGFVLSRLNRPAEAIAEVRRSLELNPNFPPAVDLLQRIQK